MYLIQAVLFTLYYSNCCYCASTRVWRNKNCDARAGFICSPRHTTVIYECPVKSKEYHIYVNEFNGQSNMESLIVRNCKTLTVLFRCTKYKWEKKRLKYLEISNIETLKIQHLQAYHSQLPPKVVLQNIKLILNIPSYSFSQVDKRNEAGCILPLYDFNSVLLRNVTIGSVNSNAFYMPNRFGNITLMDVTINNMETSSVVVTHDKHGEFLMRRGVIAVLKPFSFQIDGRRAIFYESNFTSVPSSGINATVETFYFTKNSVKSLESHALSILATNVFVFDNRFESLKAGAFEQIGPRKFGKLNFTYGFSRNDINFMEADCLHPGLIAYQNGSAEISFSENRLSCACDKLGWLLSRLDQLDVSAPAKIFYEMVFDEKSENTCSSTCDLPLSATRRMIRNGNCTQNITAQWLCENKDRSTTVSKPSLTPLKKITTGKVRSPATPTAREIQVHEVNDSVKLTTNSGVGTFFTTNNKLTTAIVTPPVLKAPRHRPINSTGKKFTNSTEVIGSTPTSNKSIASNLTLRNTPASFELKGSAEKHFVSLFLLICHLSCNVLVI